MNHSALIFRRSAAALAAGALAAAVSGPAHAQTVSCDAATTLPCRFEPPTVELERVPGVLHLQARLSRAGQALEDTRLAVMYVKVLRGDQVVCAEQLSGVPLKDGTLNVEVGAGMSCPLDKLLAENGGLALQLCLGGQVDCLKPVDLGTVPYAVRSSFAATAVRAARSSEAAQANYTHRLSADRDQLLNGRVRTGWFSAHSVAAADATALWTAEAFRALEGDGFFTWTPAGPQGKPILHVSGKDVATDRLVPLDSLVLRADRLDATGVVRVRSAGRATGLTITSGGFDVTGDSDVAGTLRVTQGLRVASQGLTVAVGGLDATGDSSLRGAALVDATLTVRDGATVARGGLFVDAGGYDVTGDSTFFDAARLSTTLTVHGATTVQTGDVTLATGAVEVTGASTAAANASATGQTTAFAMRVDGGGVEVRIPGSTLQSHVVGDGATSGVVTAQREVFAAGPVDVTGANPLVVASDARLGGALAVEGSLIGRTDLRVAPGGGVPTFVLRVDAAPDPEVVGASSFGELKLDEARASGGVRFGDLEVSGPMTGGATTARDAVTVDGAFEVGAASTLRGALSTDPGGLATLHGATVRELRTSEDTQLDRDARFDGTLTSTGTFSIGGALVTTNGAHCAPGTRLASAGPDAGRCVDINECAEGTVNCQAERGDIDAFCFNTWGSYECVLCEDGGTLQVSPNDPAYGLCVPDPDQCALGTHNCDALASCVDQSRGFSCQCPGGYSGNGIRVADGGQGCIDINECSSSNGGCAQSCNNTAGSYNCSCGTGYTLNVDGRTCDDRDECALDTDGCAQTCTNTTGSYTCGCNAGYRLNGDGRTCDDINECSEGSHNCSGGTPRCLNRTGTFSCIASTAKLIFMSSRTWNALRSGEFGADAALGGAGGNTRCQELATAAGLTGTYARLYGGSAGPISYPASSADPMYRTDGTRVLDATSAIFGGSILAPVNVDERGNTITGQRVWTGVTGTGGAAGGLECRSWDAFYGDEGMAGYGDNTDANWLSVNGLNRVRCENSLRIYCFEQ